MGKRQFSVLRHASSPVAPCSTRIAYGAGHAMRQRPVLRSGKSAGMTERFNSDRYVLTLHSFMLKITVFRSRQMCDTVYIILIIMYLNISFALLCVALNPAIV